MKLEIVNYKENFNKPSANMWEVTGLELGQQNLIVGQNATGKTRIVNVITNLAIQIAEAPATLLNGEWELGFIGEGNSRCSYKVKIEEAQVLSENLFIDGNLKLAREDGKTKIYSESSKEFKDISPPNNRLTLHVRRDKLEFPFLEGIIEWALGVRGFDFSNISPLTIVVPTQISKLKSLNAVPSVLEKMNESQVCSIIDKVNKLGYEVEAARADFSPEVPSQVKFLLLQEKGIPHLLKQYELSSGMFRAFSLLAILEYIKSSNDTGTILVDDLGEGLDFKRSKKLAEILLEETKTSNIQFIATSNDSFLMNVFPISCWNICTRNQHAVHCLNAKNSAEKFRKWEEFGLNNFDLLTSDFLARD